MFLSPKPRFVLDSLHEIYPFIKCALVNHCIKYCVRLRECSTANHFKDSVVLLSIELNLHRTMKNNYNRWKEGLKSSESHDSVPFEQSTTQNSTGAPPVYTQCCLSESNTKALHTLLHADLHSFQSADCFLCCSREPIRSGGGDETANSNPDTEDMPMVSLFCLLQWQADANTLQDGFICTEYGWLLLQSAWTFFFFTESPIRLF